MFARPCKVKKKAAGETQVDKCMQKLCECVDTMNNSNESLVSRDDRTEAKENIDAKIKEIN